GFPDPRGRPARQQAPARAPARKPFPDRDPRRPPGRAAACAGRLRTASGIGDGESVRAAALRQVGRQRRTRPSDPAARAPGPGPLPPPARAVRPPVRALQPLPVRAHPRWSVRQGDRGRRDEEARDRRALRLRGPARRQRASGRRRDRSRGTPAGPCALRLPRRSVPAGAGRPLGRRGRSAMVRRRRRGDAGCAKTLPHLARGSGGDRGRRRRAGRFLRASQGKLRHFRAARDRQNRRHRGRFRRLMQCLTAPESGDSSVFCMRARIWIFTVLVALALAINLARVSLSIAQTGEDTMRARVAAASTALRGQIDLLDARLAPRAVAMMPDLIEAVRGGDGQSPGRPDERALRAAGAVLSPQPDLFAVVNAQGAIVSRRSRPVQVLEDPARLPLSQTASGAVAPPVFATFDNALYRMASARVPGATAAAVVGMLVDDRFAAQLKSQVDADVTLIQGGRIVASSLPQGEERAQLTKWVAAPGPGYGVLQIRLPFVGTNPSGELPRGASRYAVRGARLPVDSGVHAALTVPPSPYPPWP